MDTGIFTLAKLQRDTLSEGTCPVIVYNYVTANDDGFNDFFKIDTSEAEEGCIQNIKVKIFNRWGAKVFSSDNYGDSMSEDVFIGFSQGNLTIAKNKEKTPYRNILLLYRI